MPNLFRLAQSNADALERTLAAVTAGLNADQQSALRRFTAIVQNDGRISINMRQTTLLAFLVSARHQNIYEWSKSRALKSSKTAEEIMREKLGAFWDRRIAFDRYFDDGEAFRYGALNIGGLGAKYYGDYCAVLKKGFPETLSRLAYLRADSLANYMTGVPSVNEAALLLDLAPHSHRHILATLKHAGDAVDVAEDNWPGILCSDSDYIEVILAADLARDHVESVRMARADYEIYFEYAFEDFRGRLSPAERTLIDLFVMIQTKLDELGIELGVVDGP